MDRLHVYRDGAHLGSLEGRASGPLRHHAELKRKVLVDREIPTFVGPVVELLRGEAAGEYARLIVGADHGRGTEVVAQHAELRGVRQQVFVGHLAGRGPLESQHGSLEIRLVQGDLFARSVEGQRLGRQGDIVLVGVVGAGAQSAYQGDRQQGFIDAIHNFRLFSFLNIRFAKRTLIVYFLP